MDSEVMVVSNDNNNNLRAQRCHHYVWDLFLRRKYGTGGVLHLEATSGQLLYVPIFCGGFERTFDTAKTGCHLLGPGFHGHVGELFHERYGAASIVINSGKTLWVTGGMPDPQTGTTELMDFSGMTLDRLAKEKVFGQLGIELPGELFHHCLVKILDDTTVLLIGGNLDAATTNQAWGTSVKNANKTSGKSLWKQIAPMTFRKMSHACGVIKVSEDVTVVVTAGGESVSQAVLDNVELLVIDIANDIDSISILESALQTPWIEGPKLEQELGGLVGSAMVSNHEQDRLYLAGGFTGSTYRYQHLFPGECEGTRNILVFGCSYYDNNNVNNNPSDSINCQWTSLGMSLSLGRSHMVAYLLPPFPPSDYNSDEDQKNNLK